jgi:RNA polymerase sigma-70 factor (ECF subfamily)
MTMESDPSDVEPLVQSSRSGDEASWEKLMSLYSERLRRVVAVRLDHRLRGRIDCEDVLQEVFLEAWRSLSRYSATSDVPFYVWLRAIAGNKLLECHRYHLGTQLRDARREAAGGGGMPDASSEVLAEWLADSGTSPSSAAARAELRVSLHACLDDMDAIDREVIMLRHFEQLTPYEAAIALGLNEKAAAMRYLRAVRRLGGVLGPKLTEHDK